MTQDIKYKDVREGDEIEIAVDYAEHPAATRGVVWRDGDECLRLGSKYLSIYRNRPITLISRPEPPKPFPTGSKVRLKGLLKDHYEVLEYELETTGPHAGTWTVLLSSITGRRYYEYAHELELVPTVAPKSVAVFHSPDGTVTPIYRRANGTWEGMSLDYWTKNWRFVCIIHADTGEITTDMSIA